MYVFTCFALVALAAVSSASIIIKDNGYENVLVAISPSVPEDPHLLDLIKGLLINSSESLFALTRRRVYFRDIKILIPPTWTKIKAEAYSREIYEDADLRVDQSHLNDPNDLPYTQQPRGCGEPGDFIRLTASFVYKSEKPPDADYRNAGKSLVHEWSHFRWGVFEEYGSHGDEQHPAFYKSFSYDTESGAEYEIIPTTCTKDSLKGKIYDARTSATCEMDPSTNLPDKNCWFQPDELVNKPSSIMSYTQLDSENYFCDDSEEHKHNTVAPTKHNARCGHKSVWEVMMRHLDFANNSNLPIPSAPKPRFRLIQTEKPRFVLVADTSMSMNEHKKMDRLAQAARRWIKYELVEGVALGIVSFSNYANIVADMTTVTKDTRQELMDKVPRATDDWTCIGCGLRKAQEMLVEGGTVVLITDGIENKRPKIEDVQEELVRSNIRVVTIAYSDDADPKINQLAVATQGKSFFVNDFQGLSDAFKESETYQAALASRDREAVLFETYYNSPNGKHQGSFSVDFSTGRDFVFQIDYSRIGHVVEFDLISPAGRHYFKDSAEWDRAGNIYFIKLPMAEVGTWNYKLQLNVKDHLDFAVVSVKAKRRALDIEPIHTVCSISTGSKDINPESQNVVIFAKVNQGNRPVLGANVRAEVTRPGNRTEPVVIPLWDNGVGADVTRNDGIYSRYFTSFGDEGYYAVACQVRSDGAAFVGGGFLGAKMTPILPLKAAPQPKIQLSNFTRYAPAGSFRVMNHTQEKDILPPSRIADLVANEVMIDGHTSAIQLEWTASGSDLDQGTAESHILHFGTNQHSLLAEFDLQMNVTEVDVTEGTLVPLESGQRQSVTLNSTSLHMETNVLYYFALKAVDDSNMESELSNVASAVQSPKFQVIEVQENMASKSTLLTIILITVGSMLLLVMIVSVVVYFYKSPRRRFWRVPTTYV